MRNPQVTLNNPAKTPQNGLWSGLARWLEGSQTSGFKLWLVEVLLLTLCFALVAGQPTPDVNESHYLVKAKHFWNPSFCPGDIFLSSSFSHLAFYVSTGWITLFCSLGTYAWIGRIATWVFLAAGWRKVCQQLFPVPLLSVVSGLFFVILNQRLHLAGEWVVGGFEAKGIAYGFVLFAIASMLKRNWQWVWPLFGCASAFHVLVGGWATLAAGACMLVSLMSSSFREPQRSINLTQILRLHGPALVVGFLIALVGILPPLLAESGSPHAAAAHAIYVSQRVAHHVNFAAFPVAYVGRFLVLVLLWQLFDQWYQRSGYLEPVLRQRVKLLEVFTVMTLVFSFVGLLLSGIAEQGGTGKEFANSLLRFYWFRLADFAVPASVALLTGCILARWVVDKADFPHRVCSAIFIGCIVVAGAALVQENHADGRPNADARTLLADLGGDEHRTQEIFRNWKRACRWISNNTPNDAVFFTPAQQQTFKWYAGRSEVCCWKDVPQNPEAMAQWRKRITDIVEPQRDSEVGLFVYSDAQLLELARKYEATHLLIQQQMAEGLDEPTALRQIYPEDRQKRATWAVFELGEIVDN